MILIWPWLRIMVMEVPGEGPSELFTCELLLITLESKHSGEVRYGGSGRLLEDLHFELDLE